MLCSSHAGPRGSLARGYEFSNPIMNDEITNPVSFIWSLYFAHLRIGNLELLGGVTHADFHAVQSGLLGLLQSDRTGTDAESRGRGGQDAAWPAARQGPSGQAGRCPLKQAAASSVDPAIGCRLARHRIPPHGTVGFTVWIVDWTKLRGRARAVAKPR